MSTKPNDGGPAGEGHIFSFTGDTSLAEQCYRLADAMLAAREGQQP